MGVDKLHVKKGVEEEEEKEEEKRRGEGEIAKEGEVAREEGAPCVQAHSHSSVVRA